MSAVLSRRQFLEVSTTALGGLLVGTSLSGQLRAAPAAANLGLYVRVEPDGRIVIGARGCEIGQGVKTSLPMLVAEELDAPWSAIEVEQLPYAVVPSQDPPGVTGKYGPQGAGGSTNIPDGWESLRQAGAQARWLLIRAAAQRWNVAPESLRTLEARVIHSDGRSANYAELAADASKLDLPPQALELKKPAQFRVIGRPARTVDAAEIVTGRAAYGFDARRAGALTAVVARCPYVDGEVARFDAAAARRVPGVRDVIALPGPAVGEPLERNLAAGLVVLADDTWSALKGREALQVEWTRGPWAAESSALLEKQAHAALDAAGGVVARNDGDFAAARASAARTIEARYTMPLLAHATSEPQNALIDLKPDRALLIASLQSPGGASRMISAMTGIPRTNIEIPLVRAGGGFGRRLANDFVAEAVLIALAAKRPIKLVWTRDDDLRNDFYRPFGVHALAAALDGRGDILGWQHRVAATGLKYRSRGLAEEPDWVGCADPDGFPAGAVGSYRCDFQALEFGRARGWWRAPLPTFTAFAVQSFVDEVAAASGVDALALRLKLLGEPRELPYRDHGGPKFHTGRLGAVLQKAAAEIGWGRKLPAGRGIGLASHFTFGGYTAHGIEVEVAKDGTLRIHRCVCVTDVGQVVNPLGLEAQLMGGTIDGLSTALNLQITVESGRIVQSNFNDYPLLRPDQAPDVEVHVVRTEHAPSGAGEMAIPTVAPALANAIFAASGKRIRRLPIGEQLRV